MGCCLTAIKSLPFWMFRSNDWAGRYSTSTPIDTPIFYVCRCSSGVVKKQATAIFATNPPPKLLKNDYGSCVRCMNWLSMCYEHTNMAHANSFSAVDTPELQPKDIGCYKASFSTHSAQAKA
jgi:hypothetical protein